jgi:hypothetical protein
MSTDLYDPTEYAEICADRAADLHIDLIDGVLGRGQSVNRTLMTSLIESGMSADQAELAAGDYVGQLRMIDAQAELLAAEYRKLSSVNEAMWHHIHRTHPGIKRLPESV